MHLSNFPLKYICEATKRLIASHPNRQFYLQWVHVHTLRLHCWCSLAGIEEPASYVVRYSHDRSIKENINNI